MQIVIIEKKKKKVLIVAILVNGISKFLPSHTKRSLRGG